MKKIWLLAVAAVLIFLSGVLFTVAALEMKNPPSKGGSESKSGNTYHLEEIAIAQVPRFTPQTAASPPHT